MTAEHRARAYCLSINADPDAEVYGFVSGFPQHIWITKPRWQFYLGVSEEGLRRRI